MDVVQLAAFVCAVTGILLAALLADTDSWTHRLLAPPLLRAAGAVAGRLRHEDPPDPLVEAFRAAARREQLVVDLARLRRLVARDEHMSAVRQIGNRIAYDGLLAELRRTPEPDPFGLRWADAATPVAVSTPVLSWSRSAASVEVLELGPRPRRA